MNTARQFLSLLIIKDHLPGHDEIRNEAGETIPGRTDSHVGEVNVSDGEGLDGRGDGTVGPAREGLLDQDCGSSEASDDDTDPEQSDQPSAASYIGQTMYGGGLQELLHIRDTNHPSGLLVNGTCWGPPFDNNKYFF